MANAAQNAPKMQLGNLTPEDAERLASTFRPIWELDDAPFAAAPSNAMSAADVDALSAGAGIAPSVRVTEAKQASTLNASVAIAATTEIKSFPPGHVPAPNDPKVEISIDVEPDPPTPPPAVVVAQAQPQQAQQAPTSVRKPYTPPRAPPQTVRMNRDAAGSGEFVPVKKSNTGLIVGVVGVVVVIGAIVGIRAAMSGDKTDKASSASTSTATHEEAHIPPPPDTQNVAVQAPTQTAPPVVQQAPPPPTQNLITRELPPPIHTTTNVAPPIHTTHTTPPHTGGGGHSTGHTTIVRDNPF